MSSLGDLLLAHLKPENKIQSDDEIDKNTVTDKNQGKSYDDSNTNHHSPDRTSDNLESTCKVNFVPQAPKAFPDRIERDEIDEVCSNASSTDDLVRELLDPDDRPKNVWHVVEKPKVDQQQSDDGDRSNERDCNEAHRSDAGSLNNDVDPDGSKTHLDDQLTGDYYPDISDKDRLKSSDRNHSRDERSSSRRDRSKGTSHGNDEDRKHRRDHLHKPGDSSNRDKSRSPSRRDRDRDHVRHRHERDRDKDRHQEHDNRKSSSRRDRSPDSHRSSKRRRHPSDDEDSRHNKRRRSSTRDRRSRSKSPIARKSRSPVSNRNSRTISVMQLNPRVVSRDLEDLFRSVGRVKEVRLVIDGKSRRHKGIAYIEFEDSHTASKAFKLNGQRFMGSPLIIQSADSEGARSIEIPSTSTNLTVDRPSHSRSNLLSNSYRVYAGNLHLGLNEDMLRTIFEPFGPLIRVELMKDRSSNVSRGYAFITFADSDDGKAAVQALDGFELAGKPLKVSKSMDKSERHISTTIAPNLEYISGSGSNHGPLGSSNSSDGRSGDGRSDKHKDVTASLFQLAGQ